MTLMTDCRCRCIELVSRRKIILVNILIALVTMVKGTVFPSTGLGDP
jgi:hypothetical protein